MERNKFEQEVKARMEQRTLQPSPMAWDRLDAMLSVTEQKQPVRSYRRLYIAASMVLFLAAGFFFLSQEETVTVPAAGADAVVNAGVPASGMDAEPMQKIQQQAVPVPVHETTTVAAAPGKANTRSAGGKHQEVRLHQQAQAFDKQEAAVAQNRDVPVQDTHPAQSETLVAAADISPKLAAGKVKVDAHALLSSVEGELDDSFRSKMLQSVTKNYNTVKTALVNRNHE